MFNDSKQVEKAIAVKDKIGNLLDEEQIEIGLVLGILLSMYIATAKDMANMEQGDLLGVTLQTIVKAYAEDKDDEPEHGGTIQWLN